MIVRMIHGVYSHGFKMSYTDWGKTDYMIIIIKPQSLPSVFEVICLDPAIRNAGFPFAIKTAIIGCAPMQPQTLHYHVIVSFPPEILPSAWLKTWLMRSSKVSHTNPGRGYMRTWWNLFTFSQCLQGCRAAGQRLSASLVPFAPSLLRFPAGVNSTTGFHLCCLDVLLNWLLLAVKPADHIYRRCQAGRSHILNTQLKRGRRLFSWLLSCPSSSCGFAVGGWELEVCWDS